MHVKKNLGLFAMTFIIAFTLAWCLMQIETVIVKPTFTASAYQKNGFYFYYNNTCDVRCLTVPVIQDLNFQSSKIGYATLGPLCFLCTVMTDEYLTAHPDKLAEYNRVIVLHNEYVTQQEYDAINAHKKVVYLYPNALYAKVDYDSEAHTIILVRGHNYPTADISNGFGWQHDNGLDEYNRTCDGWQFRRVSNGIQLNCYPDYRLPFDPLMWPFILFN